MGHKDNLHLFLFLCCFFGVFLDSRSQPKRLHVSNIPFRFRDPDLRAMFGVSIIIILVFLVVFVILLIYIFTHAFTCSTHHLFSAMRRYSCHCYRCCFQFVSFVVQNKKKKTTQKTSQNYTKFILCNASSSHFSNTALYQMLKSYLMNVVARYVYSILNVLLFVFFFFRFYHKFTITQTQKQFSEKRK